MALSRSADNRHPHRGRLFCAHVTACATLASLNSNFIYIFQWCTASYDAVLSTAAIAVLSTTAFAADLPSRAPPPVYIPPPAFTWAGVYLGATAGFAEGFHTFNDLNDAFFGYSGLANTQSGGFAGGGTLGVNLQAGSLVCGLEADINWLSNKTSYYDPNVVLNAFQPYETNRLNYLGTVRGRLGLAIDRTLIYFTAGLACANVNNRLAYNSASGFSTFELPYYKVDSTRSLAGSRAPVWNTV